ncbi:hypothetical protein, conserved [Leishmania tarentolae]|uniref:Uncharacterized protein n=1 Tax=Leishmania tarentolae TaxID=5689 RepID=A0A640K7B2_LEITA|nr:hypothetical protein, conserved [Leishmania tarentolae]
MSAEATTSAGEARRRSRSREPAYYYQSPSAVVDGDVQFGEGCVVLPHARIFVPLGYRLHVGAFCLFEDFAELICGGTAEAAGHRHVGDTPSSPAAKAAGTLHIGRHNHLHSYARVRCAVATAVVRSSSSPPSWQLMGSGNVLHPFASVQMTLSQPLSSLPGPPAPPPQHIFGDYNVVTTYSSVSLEQGIPLSLPASPGVPRTAASSALQHTILFSREEDTSGANASLAMTVGTFCVPRFGARSIAELPLGIHRIAHEAQEALPPSPSVGGKAAIAATPQPLSPASPPPENTTAAPPAAAILQHYVSDVHPDLRSHEETRICTELERTCRHYLHQLLDDGGVLPVASPPY